jgi:hypothetical protein
MKVHRKLAWLTTLTAVLAVIAASPVAQAGLLTIDADTSGITGFGSLTAADVDSAINTAVNTIDGLYTTGNVAGNVTLNVTFTDTNAGKTYLEQTTQFYTSGKGGNPAPTTYANYVAALTADSKANPGNTNLATAVANLPSGNQGPMILNYAQALLLSLYGGGINIPNSGSSININSFYPFGTAQPVAATVYDMVGGLEHELDEVIGGGGAGSSLNNFNGLGFGSTDLYRYACGTTAPSYTNSSTVNSCLSINGGATDLVYFNQNSGGDFGDFAGNMADGSTGSQFQCGLVGGAGSGQLIQNAFNCMGPDEAYTSASPEFIMEAAIGWDPIPEPGTLALFGTSLCGIAFLRRRRAGR